MGKKSRGATTRKVRNKERVSAWRFHHRQMFRQSLQLMMAKPLSSALTWMSAISQVASFVVCQFV